MEMKVQCRFRCPEQSCAHTIWRPPPLRLAAHFADSQIGFQELEACVLLLATEAEAAADDARSADG
ncbi:MAG: hypothetical protein U5N21_18155 [Rhodococcus sp. (in: high G+C Gram-positive bacteria)]|nr:hypothetical protein [Rhodococcus sp. (in: high G+C Gram-positive bacteria)]